MVVVERQPTAQHDVEDHAARPDVNLGSCVESDAAQGWSVMHGLGARELKRLDALSRDDFGGRVIRRAARSLEEVAVAHNVGQSKVCNLDVQVLVEQETVLKSRTRLSARSRRQKTTGSDEATTHFSGFKSRWTMLCEWQ